MPKYVVQNKDSNTLNVSKGEHNFSAPGTEGELMFVTKGDALEYVLDHSTELVKSKLNNSDMHIEEKQP